MHKQGFEVEKIYKIFGDWLILVATRTVKMMSPGC